MNARRKDEVGTTKKIMCPECDGTGQIMTAIQEGGINLTCPDCKGTGKLDAVVVKQ